MRQALQLHPDSHCEAVSGIAVEVSRPRSGVLILRYLVAGRMSDLRLPPLSEPTRADALWKHTCFEAFVKAGTGDAYCELNVAPSTQWAAYDFDAYRSGMRAADIAAPRISVHADAGQLELLVSPNLPLGGASWMLGLSAVIEEASGRLSYWALRHPPGKPDFHHSDCFALELPAPSRS
ncbi:MAG: DOMON-like domain-containing protein [Alphaproteobacteria bacterium]|nr:DOMON-like domain-containing protein [Alphaproteobacteria bacterium]